MVNNKQEDKSVSQVMTKVGGTSLKTLGIYVRNYSILFIIAVVLVIVAWFGGRRLFGAMFQATSPFAQERKDIAQKNNIRDAYSSIIGSDVGVISQNGIIKWFNSKEALRNGVTDFTHITTTKSGHYIMLSEPNLVITNIQTLLSKLP